MGVKKHKGEMEESEGDHRQMGRGSLFHVLGPRSVRSSSWFPPRKELVLRRERDLKAKEKRGG